jgi:hypothetical protein
MTDTFASSLRDELVAAGNRRLLQRARRRRALLVTAVFAAIAAAAFAGTGLLRTQQASAGVDIKVENGQLLVRLTDLESRPDVISSALRAAGLSATIEAKPVGPSEVGRFIGAAGNGPLPPELQAIDERDGTFAGFALPERWPGQLELLVGRRAEATETYFRPSNAFARGEPLACSNLAGMTIAGAVDNAPAGLPIRVVAISETGQPEQFGSLADAAVMRPSYLIAGAQAFSPADVVIFATPDGSQPLTSPRPPDGRC